MYQQVHRSFVVVTMMFQEEYITPLQLVYRTSIGRMS